MSPSDAKHGERPGRRFAGRAVLLAPVFYLIGVASLFVLPALGTTFPFGQEVPWSDAEVIVDREGRVIVLSRLYGRIMVYDDQDRFRHSWQGFVPGGSGGQELASSQHGEIFLCHSGGGGQAIHQFTPAGLLVRSGRDSGTHVDGWRLATPTTFSPITDVGGELRSVRRIADVGDVLCAPGWVQPAFTNAAGCRLISRWGSIRIECSDGSRRLAQKWWLWSLTWPLPGSVLSLLAIAVIAISLRSEIGSGRETSHES